MSRQAKTVLAYMGAFPIAFGMLLYLLDSRFVTRAEAQVIESSVMTLQEDMRDLKAGVQLGNCLAMAEIRKEPWQECVK